MVPYGRRGSSWLRGATVSIPVEMRALACALPQVFVIWPNKASKWVWVGCAALCCYWLLFLSVIIDVACSLEPLKGTGAQVQFVGRFSFLLLFIYFILFFGFFSFFFFLFFSCFFFVFFCSLVCLDPLAVLKREISGDSGLCFCCFRPSPFFLSKKWKMTVVCHVVIWCVYIHFCCCWHFGFFLCWIIATDSCAFSLFNWQGRA